MTREENLHWLNQEILTWENECQSKHPIKEALYAARKALKEQRKGHWIGHREHCENLGVMPSGLGAYEWCSNCDCGIDVREWHRNHYNFCPNCGADMREDK
jgi:hypothetical protein